MALDSTTQREADSAEGSPLGDRDAEDIVGGAGTREGFTYASDEESQVVRNLPRGAALPPRRALTHPPPRRAPGPDEDEAPDMPAGEAAGNVAANEPSDHPDTSTIAQYLAARKLAPARRTPGGRKALRLPKANPKTAPKAVPTCFELGFDLAIPDNNPKIFCCSDVKSLGKGYGPKTRFEAALHELAKVYGGRTANYVCDTDKMEAPYEKLDACMFGIALNRSDGTFTRGRVFGFYEERPDAIPRVPHKVIEITGSKRLRIFSSAEEDDEFVKPGLIRTVGRDDHETLTFMCDKHIGLEFTVYKLSYWRGREEEDFLSAAREALRLSKEGK